MTEERRPKTAETMAAAKLRTDAERVRFNEERRAQAQKTADNLARNEAERLKQQAAKNIAEREAELRETITAAYMKVNGFIGLEFEKEYPRLRAAWVEQQVLAQAARQPTTRDIVQQTLAKAYQKPG